MANARRAGRSNASKILTALLAAAWLPRQKPFSVSPHVSLRPSQHIHVQSFGRFDEILYLVEKTSALTLTDCRPLPHPCSSLSLLGSLRNCLRGVPQAAFPFT